MSRETEQARIAASAAAPVWKAHQGDCARCKRKNDPCAEGHPPVPGTYLGPKGAEAEPGAGQAGPRRSGGAVLVSYCCRAICLAHGRDVYVDIQCRAWVHADGWACEGMAETPIHPEDLK